MYLHVVTIFKYKYNLILQGDDTANNSKNEIEELRKSLSESKTALRSRDADLDAIKRQAESTNREYDRLTEEYQKLQVC